MFESSRAHHINGKKRCQKRCHLGDESRHYAPVFGAFSRHDRIAVCVGTGAEPAGPRMVVPASAGAMTRSKPSMAASWIPGITWSRRQA